MKSVTKLNDSNIKQICRTCLKINTEKTSIFDEIEQVDNDENGKLCIYDILMAVALIEVDTKENLPTLICIHCLRLTQLLFNFKKQCSRSQAILLKYLTEKEYTIIRTLDAKESTSKDSNVLNKKPILNEFIDIEQSIEIKHESTIMENDAHEISNPGSLLNAGIKLEFVHEIIKSDVESETEKEDKVIGVLGAEKSSNQDDILNKKLTTELIDIEESINEDKHESVTIHEFSNHSSFDDSLNANIKLKFVDEIIKSDTESECEETLHLKVFTCELCDKSFKTKKLFIIHMKQNSEDRCVCKVCNKRFKDHKNLNVHYLRKHVNEKRYSCKICGKRYQYSDSLNTHVRKHSTIEKQLCSVCGKRFKNSITRKVHMTTHTEKPILYKCNICGKPFSTKSCFISHLGVHTGEKPFECKECGKAFSLPRLLKWHSTIHTALKK